MTLDRLAHDEAPPPYTPSDPLTPSSSNISTTTGETQQQTAVEYVPLYSHSIAPANFISARGYFQERPPPRQHQPDEEILEHALTIYTRSKAKDYHRFPRCWRSRSEEISKHDWKAFLNYLFPTRLGPVSQRPDLPPKLRAELERDQKDRPQESDEERKNRIAAVVSEWNDFFFVPRGTAVIYCYGSEDGSASVSPLCPNCYPSSVRSMQPGQDATRGPRAAGTTSSLTLVDSTPTPTPPSGDVARNADAEPPTQPETRQTGSTEPHNCTGGAPSLGLFAGAVNLVQNWANRKAQWAQMYGEQAGEWGMAFGQHAHDRGVALGKHAELHGKILGARAEALGKTIEQRADWAGHKVCDPWWFGGGYGWDGTRQRRDSWSSSSSSSESSDDDDYCDSVSTLSADSDWDVDDLAALRVRMQSLRERYEEARNVISHNANDVLRQKQELLAVRTAHRELRESTRRYARSKERKPSMAERKAIKEELRGLKRDYRALRKQSRSERMKVRKEEKKRRKEERKVRKEAKKAAKKVNRRQTTGRGQCGQRSRREGRCGRDPDPVHEVETGIVNTNIQDEKGASSRAPAQDRSTPALPTPSNPQENVMPTAAGNGASHPSLHAPMAFPHIPPPPIPPAPPAPPEVPGNPGHHHHHHHHHHPTSHGHFHHPLHMHAHAHRWGRGGWPFGAYHRHYHPPGNHPWGPGRGRDRGFGPGGPGPSRGCGI